MRGMGILIAILVFIVIGMLLVYFFVPFNTVEFNPTPVNSNFSLSTENVQMQFYENMRYKSNRISYRIDDCPLQRRDNMKRAFDILENRTVLDFYEVDFGEEILVECENTVISDSGLFIAGEGGPTNITISGDFNVIYKGRILLLRDSKCSEPNVGLHELLHALGFDHSENQGNIMYEVSKCSQTLGEDIPELINTIYNVSPYADISFENVSVNMQGKYLNANLSIRNKGLKYSESFDLIIYADEKKVKEVEIEPMDIGYGTRLSLFNIWISKLNVEEVSLELVTDFEELDYANNKVLFTIND